jgi:hypothetical protein
VRLEEDDKSCFVFSALCFVVLVGVAGAQNVVVLHNGSGKV